MIYRIEPGKIGGHLQKTRLCCRVNHSSCQGNLCSVSKLLRDTVLSPGQTNHQKGRRYAGHRASMENWSSWQGISTPKADRVLERHSRKQSRETASALQWGSSFPSSKPEPGDSSAEQSVLSGTSSSGEETWTSATVLPPVADGLVCREALRGWGDCSCSNSRRSRER